MSSYHDDDEVLGKAYDNRLMMRLLAYVKPYKGIAALGIGLTAVSSALIISGPFIVGMFIDVVLRQIAVDPDDGLLGEVVGMLGPMTPSGGADTAEFIPFIAIVLVLIELLRFFVDYGNSLLLQSLGQRVLYDMRQQLFSHLQRQSLSFFQRQPVGRLVTRLANDIGALNELFSSGIVTIFRDIFLIAGVGTAMMLLAASLGLVSLSVIPLIVGVTFVFQHFIRKYYRNVRKALSRINAYISEQINGMREVQIFGREEHNRGRFREINDEHQSWLIRTIRTHGFYRPAITILYSVSLALVLVAGGVQHLTTRSDGTVLLTIGVLVTFTQLVQHLFRPIQDLADKYNILQAAMASSERIFQLIDVEPSFTDPAEPRDDELRGKVRGRITFEDVHFRYRPDDPILRGVSFDVKTGQHVAIVGHTGAGKSTCINLLGRYYDVEKGRVLLDGIDLRELSQRFIREHIAIVHQDVFCFAGTIAENINLNNEAIGRDRIEAAARAVNAHEFIEKLPKRYDSEVTEGGKTFSLGERQLLAFARALAYDPPILVLDEATASIDTHTEALIQDALTKLIRGRTAIIIAHRLSTIKECDCIYVMQDGLLTEQGTHDELLAHDGHYRTLYELQFADQEATVDADAAYATAPTTADDDVATLTTSESRAPSSTAGEEADPYTTPASSAETARHKALGPLLPEREKPDPHDIPPEGDRELADIIAEVERESAPQDRSIKRATRNLDLRTHAESDLPIEED